MCKGSSACEAPRAEAGERVGRHLRKGPECQAELSSSVCRGQWGAREEFRAGEEAEPRVGRTTESVCRERNERRKDPEEAGTRVQAVKDAD